MEATTRKHFNNTLWRSAIFGEWYGVRFMLGGVLTVFLFYWLEVSRHVFTLTADMYFLSFILFLLYFCLLNVAALMHFSTAVLCTKWQFLKFHCHRFCPLNFFLLLHSSSLPLSFFPPDYVVQSLPTNIKKDIELLHSTATRYENYTVVEDVDEWRTRFTRSASKHLSFETGISSGLSIFFCVSGAVPSGLFHCYVFSFAPEPLPLVWNNNLKKVAMKGFHTSLQLPQPVQWRRSLQTV